MKWNIKSEKQFSNSSIYQLIQILLKSRGIETKDKQKEFLHPLLQQLEKDFFNKLQLKKAILRIQKAIKEKEQIIVYSDYDVDGIAAAAIVWETLYWLGAQVMPFVPDRFQHGYGLSKKGIDRILQDYPETKLIVTVDNGISASDEVEILKEKGIDTIITDHHTIPKKKPDAHAIIHTTELSGSGVAYIFSSIINKQLNNEITEQSNDEHLALAALGTIADLVPLTGANRTIVKYGLNALNKTKRIGLKALIDICGLTDQKIESYHVGFVLGPRINASGRLSHGLSALQLLCTKDKIRARKLSHQLQELNTNRRETMKQTFEHAALSVKKKNKLIFVSDSSYHEGVIGLVAGNLVDKYYKPSVVVSVGEKISKASARSVRGVNIYTLLNSISGDFDNFGGHPMAAGFSVKTDQLSDIENKLTEIFENQVTDEDLVRQLSIDMKLSFSDITQKLYKEIQCLKPFGIGNQEPVFMAENVEIIDKRTVGREGSHLKLRVKQKGQKIMEAIGFNMGFFYNEILDKQISLAYSIMENEWNGNKTLQLKLKDIKHSYNNK